MKQESDQVKEQLGVAVDTLGDLGHRIDRAEKRLDGLTDDVNLILDKRLADQAQRGALMNTAGKLPGPLEGNCPGPLDPLGSVGP